MTAQHKKKILALAVCEILDRHGPTYLGIAAYEIAEYFFEREERIREVNQRQRRHGDEAERRESERDPFRHEMGE